MPPPPPLLYLRPLLWMLLVVITLAGVTSQQSPVSSSLADLCGPEEYWSNGHCCRRCPAGEHVQEPCSSPHTSGKCRKCDRETYTEFPNGLLSCLPCVICFEGQVVVEECTPTRNRLCQCQEGRLYKASVDSEFCTPCSRCPPGKVVLQKCNSTADTVCGVPSPVSESRHRFILVGTCIFVLVAGFLGFWFIKVPVKKPKDGGFQAVRLCLPNGVSTESLEPLEKRALDRDDSKLPERSRSSKTLLEAREADSSVLAPGHPRLSADSVVIEVEVPEAAGGPLVQGLQETARCYTLAAT